jgi:beta-N-acetylhexosaminidase
MDDELSLIQSVAQRMIVGMQGERMMDLLTMGVGGFIAFASDLQGLSPAHIQQKLSMLQASRPSNRLPLWLGVDQEGGPVERLAPDQLVSLPSALAMALAAPTQPSLASFWPQQAQDLATLGFNLHFSPVLDVNTEPTNPVIGTRAYSHDPAEVAMFGHKALQTITQAGLMPVAKHFPGHGGGTVDSHEGLPQLPLTPVHLHPFLANLPHIPALMMACVFVCPGNSNPVAAANGIHRPGDDG